MQIKTFKAEAVYRLSIHNKLIIYWTHQTNQINELASLNETFKIGSECEGWGQDYMAGGEGGVGVGWGGVGGGRMTILTNCNSRCFLTFLILLFLFVYFCFLIQ